ncbi:flagellar component of cell-proximal portion of basal-body rod [Tepidanaerobacter acetatoxydans Re1]|uniref:Flagellar basal-body rod protein FlgC n=1 Tax=Tepidanaerobacter acetatoxydans (strain DSM 21804 / JCM 16047 / Re1) TaxID=1209989 RepID=F4LTN3_TEPAE|nr:flagellar basal body rod protein FlgC [Tepidanaerobacter acetatoxydans]AEE91363.1 flagellar basal-body rod protein FlgC [Tepidanaerobacter acetatoxydans Re1]CCP26057.1 flagellar component of cell-proximal portion of basal-body rod [Tepidanaerobacter acetatoxydans Re1]
MGFFNSLDISASGLTAQRLRLDTISNNIANANTTRTEEGGPFQRERVVFQERNTTGSFSNYLDQQKPAGVRVVAIEKDTAPFKALYDPTHPDADPSGYVMLPNVNIVTEMVDMISATRSYEANVTAINSAKSMMSKALEISKI